MSSRSAWSIPFFLNPHNLTAETVVVFAVSVLLAVMINAEAQAFVAGTLGDTRVGAKDRFHFNAFLHLSLLGTICYLVGGFGWPRTMDVDSSKFKYPRLYTVLTRFAGPVANLVLASIASSLIMAMHMFSWEGGAFPMVIGVNVTTAIYSLIPLPPLAGGSLAYELIPSSQGTFKSIFLQAGPFAAIAVAFLERLGYGPFGHYLNPIIQGIFHYIISGV